MGNWKKWRTGKRRTANFEAGKSHNVIRAVIARRILPKQSPAWCAYLQLRWKRLERDCRAAKDAARNDDTGLLHNVSSLVDQIRRASRSVSTNIAKAWRKQRYKAAFIAKPGDAETEACETQVWMNFSRRCEYFDGTDVD